MEDIRTLLPDQASAHRRDVRAWDGNPARTSDRP